MVVCPYPNTSLMSQCTEDGCRKTEFTPMARKWAVSTAFQATACVVLYTPDTSPARKCAGDSACTNSEPTDPSPGILTRTDPLAATLGLREAPRPATALSTVRFQERTFAASKRPADMANIETLSRRNARE